MTYTQYEGNPVIANTELGDFRDPKVFWHEESRKWVMALALGWSCKIEFWGSADLKTGASSLRSQQLVRAAI